MKRLTIISLLTAILLFNGSCNDYLDVNKNIDAPDVVEEYLYLSGIIQSMAPYWDTYYDLYAIAPMTQMFATNSSVYTGYANHYTYSLTSDVGAVVWRQVYFTHGMNLENFINQSIAEQKWTMAGIGYAIKAFDWDMLTKIYGEAPMKEAFSTGRTEYNYDYQPDIYTQVREWAYKAIEYLAKEDNHVYGNKLTGNDWIYGGDKDKWTKFAYAVIVRNLASLSNKNDFTTKYADELIECAKKSFSTADDDAVIKVSGGSQQVPYAYYNNAWGTARASSSFLGQNSFQHDYAVQVMTGTIPQYATDGKRVKLDPIPPTHTDTLRAEYYPYQLLDKQIICDTVITIPGHYDPRVALKLSASDYTYKNIDNADSVKAYKYYGGQTSTSAYSPQSVNVTSFYGRAVANAIKNATTNPPNDGIGRWIYRDNAPYILTTCAEIKLCLAEAYWKKGEKDLAFTAFKEGISADITFTGKYIYPGSKGKQEGGDKITTTVYNKLANEYLAGPYVSGLKVSDFTLSHIMMQKWVALYPWGAIEAWTDLRKYHYDIAYTGEYPYKGNGWDDDLYITTKQDTDPNKVYKGFYLGSSRGIEFRNSLFNVNNQGSPCYRIRPRYNSEYVWNLQKLADLKPIPGTAPYYQCSIPWFAYPSDYPETAKGFTAN